MTTTVAEPRVSYSLLSSKGSKSICLRVNRDGSVTVRAPRFVTKSTVEQFVGKRSAWIVEKQKYFEQLLGSGNK